jgi:methylated-DNA-[protein]-cysteine S-methyltransferase
VSIPTHLDARFRERAASDGLLDVAYDVTDSPVGPLLVAATRRGVCRIAFDPEPDRAADELARAFGVRVLRSPRPVDEARRQLEAYFAGTRSAFELDVDLDPLAPFQRSVLEELRAVAYGRTETYGGLAARIGRPGAARAVGSALNRNPVPIVVPCHRVVGSDGRLVGYAGGLERKRRLLELEAGQAQLIGS